MADSIARIGIMLDPSGAVDGWNAIRAASNADVAAVTNAVSGTNNVVNTHITVI